MGLLLAYPVAPVLSISCEQAEATDARRRAAEITIVYDPGMSAWRAAPDFVASGGERVVLGGTAPDISEQLRQEVEEETQRNIRELRQQDRIHDPESVSKGDACMATARCRWVH